MITINRFHYILILFFFFSIQVQAQDKAIKQVTQILHAQADNWNSGDIEAFMQDYWQSDNLQFIGKQGITKGWNNTLENYKKGYPDKAAMGKLSFEILDITKRSRKVISMVGRFTLEREKDQPTGIFLLIWQKIKGKWVIVADYTA